MSGRRERDAETSSPSSRAEAGGPVRRGFSIDHDRLWVLDRPVEPADDSGALGMYPCRKTNTKHQNEDAP